MRLTTPDPMDALADAIARRPEGFTATQEWALRAVVVMLLGRDPYGLLDVATDGNRGADVGLLTTDLALRVLDVVRGWLVPARHHFGLLSDLRPMPRVFAQAAKDCRADLKKLHPMRATADDEVAEAWAAKACISVAFGSAPEVAEDWAELCTRGPSGSEGFSSLIESVPGRLDRAMAVCNTARSIVEAFCAATESADGGAQ